MTRAARRFCGVLLTALLLGALALAGCGSSSGKPSLTVSAASSLQASFTQYAKQFPGATLRFSFAGSDMLAAQIEQGLRPDVFASANLTLPALLYRKGLVQKPTTFAANRLVLAVPASSKITSIADVERPGVTVAIGSPTVPIGIYTRQVLARLGAGRAKILANVRTEEPEVAGIIGKLTEGAVDAGFTYVTDVRATGGKLKAVGLPRTLQPVVAYGVAVVKGSSHQTLAQLFVAGLLHGAGQQALSAAGFMPAPRGG